MRPCSGNWAWVIVNAVHYRAPNITTVTSYLLRRHILELSVVLKKHYHSVSLSISELNGDLVTKIIIIQTL